MAADSWHPDSDIIDFVKWLLDTDADGIGTSVAEAIADGDLDTDGLAFDDWLWKGESEAARDAYEVIRGSVETDPDVQEVFNDWKTSRSMP